MPEPQEAQIRIAYWCHPMLEQEMSGLLNSEKRLNLKHLPEENSQGSYFAVLMPTPTPKRMGEGLSKQNCQKIRRCPIYLETQSRLGRAG